MKIKLCPVADEMLASPMKAVSVTLPTALIEAVDRAAVRDDEGAPNRSSIARRALIQFLRRQEAA
jgi:metal-responsive CopG/Arc/MetJ family transcriptional regulator